MITNSPKKPIKFLAIDFETANYYRDSACAVGLVRVEDNKIIAKRSYLIKPPSSWFVFSDLHGITWNDVKNELTFGELWPELKKYFIGVDFVAAHNAPFDRSVLVNCCEKYGVRSPNKPFECTMRLSRKFWGLEYCALDYVCKFFNISLNHHDPLSDALACAKIMIKTIKRGYLY